MVYPLANLLATEQIRFGDMLVVDWDGKSAHLSFQKEGEGAVVPRLRQDRHEARLHRSPRPRAERWSKLPRGHRAGSEGSGGVAVRASSGGFRPPQESIRSRRRFN